MSVAVANLQQLTTARIFRFYSPLAASWLFMAVESPVAIAIISRLPDGQLNTAAFLIMMGLSLWIESPVIDLLSTSTTLSTNYRDYRTLRRFALQLMAFVTAVHAIVAWTPLYWNVTVGLMRVPREVAEAARIGMMIMVPWSAFIGWRRFLQGVLIRYGRTKRVGVGTFVRMSTMAAVGGGLYAFSSLPAIPIAAIALVFSVAFESAYVHFASRSVVRENLVPGRNEGGEPLTIRALLKFHLPLTATTSVMMLGTPLVGSALSRASNSVLMLAGWQVATALLWLHRTVVFALPEVVIALYSDAESARKLKRFSIGAGLVTTGLMLVTAATGLDGLVFTGLLRANRETAHVAHIAFIASAATPLIGALQSYVRGMLTAHRLTIARFAAVLVSVGALAGLLTLSVMLGWAGVGAAALALTLALVTELGVLTYSWRRGIARVGAAGQSEPVEALAT
jgi:hypothetical protein